MAHQIDLATDLDDAVRYAREFEARIGVPEDLRTVRNGILESALQRDNRGRIKSGQSFGM